MNILRPSRRLLIAGAVALLAAVGLAVIADDNITTARDGFGPSSPVMSSLSSSTPSAFIEDTPSTVFHWKADDWNAIRFPEAFDSSVWSKLGSSAAAPVVTANAALNPYGTATDAERIDFGALSGSGQRSIVYESSVSTGPAGAFVTGSVFLRAVSSPCTTYMRVGAASYYNTATACPVTSSGWTRCSASVLTATTGNVNFILGNDAESTSGEPTTQAACSVYAWGAQAVRSPVAPPYKSPAPANLLSFPNLNSGWNNGLAGGGTAAVRTANAVAAPDGTSATRIDFAATTSGQAAYLYQSSTSTATTVWTFEVWLQAVSSPGTVYINIGSGTPASQVVQACNVTTTWTKCSVSSSFPNNVFASIGPDSRTGSNEPSAQPAMSVYAGGASLTRADQNGDTFVMTGTVPVNTTTAHYPRGYSTGRRFVGPFSDTNYFTATGTDFPGPFTVCVAYQAVDYAGQTWIYSNGSSTSGWFLRQDSGGTLTAAMYDGSSKGVSVANTVLGAMNVVCVGRTSSTFYGKANGGASSSVSIGTPVIYGANGYIGRYGATGGNRFYNGRIYEIWATTTGWDEANVSAIQAAAMQNGGKKGLFPDDPNTVLHLIGDAYDGTTWKAPQGAATSFGTVGYSDAFVPAAGAAAPSFGTSWSTATRLTLGSGSDSLDFPAGAPFSGCVVQQGASSSAGTTIGNGGAGTAVAGWDVSTGATNSTFLTSNGTTGGGVSTSVATNALNVLCFGRDAGGTNYIKANLGPLVSNAFAYAPSTSAVVKVGTRSDDVNWMVNSGLYEVWFSNDTPSDALFTKIQRRVLQQMTSQGQPLALTRTTTSTYEVPAASGPTIFTAPAGITAQPPDGTQTYRQNTNLSLQSETLDAAPWAVGGTLTVTANSYSAPDGTTSMEKLSNSVTGWVGQSSTGLASSAGPYTGSMWVRADTGTSNESVLITNGSAPTSCTCGRSDGGSCTASINANNCVAYSTVGTQPVRLWATATFTTPATTATIYAAPGIFGSQFGTGGFWGAQLETGTYPTPYITTTSATVQRNADVLSIPNPIQVQDTQWCVDGTYTPGYGRAWYDSDGTSHTLWSATPLNLDSPNSARLEIVGPKLAFVVNDGRATQSRLEYRLPIAAGAHKVRSCVADARMALYLDGNLVTAGKLTPVADWKAPKPGAWELSPTNISIGSRANGTSFWDGTVRDFSVQRDRLSRADLATIDGLINSSVDWSASGPLMDDDLGTVLHWTADGNLLRFSNNLAASSWATTSNLTITPGQLGPDNSTNAALVTKNDTANGRFQPTVNLLAGTYTFSWYVKAGTATTMVAGLYNSTFAPCTPRIESGPGGVSGTTTVAVNGLSTTQWTRASITCTVTAGNWQALIYPESSGSGTAGATQYLFGPMLVKGDKALPYSTPVAANLLVKPMVVGDTTNSAWGSGGTPTITLNNVAAPDGTLTASKVAFAASTGSTTVKVMQNLPAATRPLSGSITAGIWLRGDAPGTVYLAVMDGAANFPLRATCNFTTSWSYCSGTGSIIVSTRDHYFQVGVERQYDSANQAGQPAQTVYMWGASLTRADENGDTFAMNGTVSYTDSPLFQNGSNVRRGLGSFTDSNYLSSSTAPISGSADKTVCMAFDYPAGTVGAGQTLFYDGGMIVQLAANGAMYLSHAGASIVYSAANPIPGALNVICFGTSGSTTTKYIRLNQQATVSNGAAAVTATQLLLGRHNTGGYTWPGRIYEVWATTTAWDENTVSKQLSRALTTGDSSQPLFLPDANTVLHLKGGDYSGGTLWAGDYPFTVSKNGTVPYGDVFPPPISGTRSRLGIGPYSGSNYLTVGSGADVLDFAGDFSMCVVYTLNSGSGTILANGAYGTSGAGYMVVVGGLDTYTSANVFGRTNATPVALPGLNVQCVGRTGTTQYVKVNLGATVTGAAAAATPAPTTPARTGVAYAIGAPLDGAIIELWASTTPPSDALFTKIQQKVLGHYAKAGQIFTNARSTSLTYEVPRGADLTQSLYYAPASVNAAAPLGVASWRQSTNLVNYSEAADNAYWNKVGSVSTFPTVSANTATAPDGQTTAERVTWPAVTAGYSSFGYAPGWAVTTGNYYTWSVYLRNQAGSSSIYLYCYSVATGFLGTVLVTPTTQWQRFSTTWAPGVNATVQCYVGADVATTGTTMSNSAVAAQTLDVWGMQFEQMPFPSPYIATTSSSVQRNADDIRETNPLSGYTGPWCISTTYSNNNGTTFAGGMRVWSTFGGSAVANNAWLRSDGGSVTLITYDASITSRQITTSVSWTNGQPHKVVACSGNGIDPQLYIDGVSTGTLSGTGAPTDLSAPSTLFIGGAAGQYNLDGYIQSFKTCKGTYATCAAQF